MSDMRAFRRRLIFCSEIFAARCMGKPFIVFTQALGPFEKRSSRILATLFLPRVDLLIARGKSTFEHLKKIGITQRMDIPVCADSAFLLPSASSSVAHEILAQRTMPTRPLLGIIPNIQVFRRLHPTDTSNPYIQLLATVCDYGISKLGAEVVFICHERYAEVYNDEWLARQIIGQTNYPDKINIVTAAHSTSELKVVIRELEFVVASRFHSIVSAISVATPFLVISWAHKYHELVADIGMEDRVFDAQKISAEAFIKTLDNTWHLRQTTRFVLLLKDGQTIKATQPKLPQYLRKTMNLKLPRCPQLRFIAIVRPISLLKNKHFICRRK